jgi:hypothetical protein
MSLLMARRAEGDQILGRVIALSASWLNVVDLKIHHAPARLATPAVSLQDFTAELAISLGLKHQAWSEPCLRWSRRVTRIGGSFGCIGDEDLALYPGADGS